MCAGGSAHPASYEICSHATSSVSSAPTEQSCRRKHFPLYSALERTTNNNNNNRSLLTPPMARKHLSFLCRTTQRTRTPFPSLPKPQKHSRQSQPKQKQRRTPRKNTRSSPRLSRFGQPVPSNEKKNPPRGRTAWTPFCARVRERQAVGIPSAEGGDRRSRQSI